MPWLYHQESAENLLTDDAITTSYEFPDSQLAITASVFHANGSFLGYRRVTGGLLQLCKNNDAFMDAAYVFGTTFRHSVSGAYFAVFFSSDS